MSQSKCPEKCSVGEHCESECHIKSYTNIVSLTDINTLTAVECQLVHLRSGVSTELLSTICEHHKVYFLKKYETYQTSCLDPFQCHKKKINKTLRTVTIEFCDKINNTPVLKKAIPGQKLCNACREKIQKYKSNEKREDEIEELELETDTVVCQIEKSVSKTKTLEEVNRSLEDLGESPIKFHAIPSHSKSAYVKRKVKSAHFALKSKVCKVLERDFSTEKDAKEIPLEVKKKADDLDMLVDLMKKKLPMTRKEKIQLLTLAPTSWSRKKVADEFNVSEYSVRKARVLCKEKGLIALPEPKVGKELDQNTVELVKNKNPLPEETI